MMIFERDPERIMMYEKKVLNLGCGKDIKESKKKEFVNLDIANIENLDVRADLRHGIPFKDDSFEKVLAIHVLEHLCPDDFVTSIEEIYRVLKKGGILEVEVPYFRSVSAFKDPTHQSFFTEDTFKYFTPEHKFSYYTDVSFEIIKIELKWHTWKIWNWINSNTLEDYLGLKLHKLSGKPQTIRCEMEAV